MLMRIWKKMYNYNLKRRKKKILTRPLKFIDKLKHEIQSKIWYKLWAFIYIHYIFIF